MNKPMIAVVCLLASTAPTFAAQAKRSSNGNGIAHSRSQDRDISADSDNELNQIVEDCKKTNADCISHFERYARAQKEFSTSGSFNLFGLFKGGGLTFWGASEELNYTQLVYPYDKSDSKPVEYQIGYGYILYAKQRDANIGADTFVSALAIGGKADAKQTRYSASIIGIAPEGNVNCVTLPMPSPDMAKNLLCSLDMQPTVTQSYFQTAAARIALAYDGWRRNLVPDPEPSLTPTPTPTPGSADAGATGKNTPSSSQDTGAISGGKAPTPTSKPPQICPQIINFRYKDRTAFADETKTPEEIAKIMKPVLDRAKAINEKLKTICGNPMPNAHVTFKTGAGDKPNLSGGIKLGDGKASDDNTEVTQGYYRNQFFLANTRWRTGFYADKDQWAELTMTGLTRSASLPSILASVITLTHSDMRQDLVVSMYCSGGTTPVGVANNPMSNPVAFTKMVDNIRTAVDRRYALPAPCMDNLFD